MIGGWRRVFAAGLLFCGLTVAPATPAAAQQRCTLQINAPVRNSVATEGAGGYTHHLGGGTIRLRCGGAVMTGDSAVHHEAEARAEMIGNVSYRDTTRTLSADRLDYYEVSSRVVATGDVELVRLSNGARLRGPRVTFLRGLGAEGRTLATGRPHMTVPASRGGTAGGEPVKVDADETEFIGEELALARGDVVIERSDFDATADSTRFEGDLGRLYGRPQLTARNARMVGDSIHAQLADEGLDWLHSFGNARVTGESVTMAGDEIEVQLAAGEISRIEVFGAARSLAGGEAFLIAGDSLDIAFTGGRPDSVMSVGTARTFQLDVELDPGVPLSEPAADLAGGASWVQGDSVRVWLEPGPAQEGSDAVIRRLRAVGDARSYFAAVRDTARSPRESRNYILGSAVDIRFEGGEPVSVTAEQAIGVYLEPSDETVPAAGTPSTREGP